MEAETLSLALHMIVFGYLLGSDWVVDQRTFYFMHSSDVTPQERSRQMKSLLLSDQHPRMGLILFIATGYTVEILYGWSPFGTEMLPVIWGVCALWFAEIWVSFLNEAKPWGRTLVTIDMVWRYVLAAFCAGSGIYSLLGGGFYPSSWMGLKYALLGTLIGGGVTVRFAVRELQAAWPGYMQSGSTPEFEEILQRCMYRAIYVTWSIWVMYGVMVALLIWRPF